jgi:hypothetical protein
MGPRCASLVEDASTPKQPDDRSPTGDREVATGAVIGDCGLLEKDVDGKREIELVYVSRRMYGEDATEMAGAVRDTRSPNWAWSA